MQSCEHRVQGWVESGLKMEFLPPGSCKLCRGVSSDKASIWSSILAAHLCLFGGGILNLTFFCFLLLATYCLL